MAEIQIEHTNETELIEFDNEAECKYYATSLNRHRREIECHVNIERMGDFYQINKSLEGTSERNSPIGKLLDAICSSLGRGSLSLAEKFFLKLADVNPDILAKIQEKHRFYIWIFKRDEAVIRANLENEAKSHFAEFLRNIACCLNKSDIAMIESSQNHREKIAFLCKIIFGHLRQKKCRLYETFMASLALTNIEKNLPVLVKEIDDMDCTLAAIGGFLTSDERDRIQAPPERHAQVANLYECIRGQLITGRIDIYNCLIVFLAGFYPKVFKILVRKEPIHNDIHLSAAKEINSLKETIKRLGFKPNRDADKEISNQNYVSLKIIKHENHIGASNKDSGPYGEHFMEYQGMKTSDIDLPNLIDRSGTGKIILLQGRCGVGKTTTVQNWCQEWAKNNCLKQFFFIFFIHVRRLSLIDRDITLHELLTCYSLYPIELSNKWMSNWPDKILIVIDGLDELSNFSEHMTHTCSIKDMHTKVSSIEILMSLLRRNLLPTATLICTSRPFSNLDKLNPDLDYEIFGLTQGKIVEFIQRNVSLSKQETVIQILKYSPAIMSACSITYYASAISSILEKDDKLNLAGVTTYTELTALIIRQHAFRKTDNELKHVGYFRALPPLAELAGHVIVRHKTENGLPKISFEMKDLLEVESPDIEKSIEIAQDHGLVQVTKVKFDGNPKNILEFSHLSVQEFLGALHILKGEVDISEMVVGVLAPLIGQKVLNMLQLYLYGIAFNDKSENLRLLRECFMPGKQISLSKKTVCEDTFRYALAHSAFSEAYLSYTANYSTLLRLCQIAYESQNVKLVEILKDEVFKGKKLLHIRKTLLNAFDIKALVFVAMNASLTKVQFYGANIDDYLVTLIVDAFKSYKKLEALDLTSNQIGKQGLSALSELLRENKSIKRLDLPDNQITPGNLEVLLPGLNEERKPLKLSIGRNPIGVKGCEYLATVLSKQTCTGIITGLFIQNLQFGPSSNRIGTEGAIVICRALNANTNLRVLNLWHNNIGPEGGVVLGEALKQNKTLAELFLSGNPIGDQGAITLAVALHVNNSLKYLDLWGCSILREGGIALASALLENRSLSNLSLNDNQLGEAAGEIFGKVVQVNDVLEQLWLSNTDIGDGNGRAIYKSWNDRSPYLDVDKHYDCDSS